ncbi:hypothetical protein ACTWJ8_39885 (plasmid) [Streptomyces sp. SDT5-1]|uniref:hypothetical protein n=1 Tax=Streptomyces sp. SDT5-1 TaxID=3406418 RepID=UPI003FD16A77
MSAVALGRVHEVVHLRYSAAGTPVARFWLVEAPFDPADTAKTVIVTVHGDAARNASEALTPGVHVVAIGEGRLANSPHRPGQQQRYLDNAHVGIDLRQHVAYVDNALPGVLAGRVPAAA